MGEDQRMNTRESLVAVLLRHGHAEWDEFDAGVVADVLLREWLPTVTPRVDIERKAGEFATCKVWVDGRLTFDGVDRTALLRA